MKKTAILIADDDPQVVELIQAYLEKEGFAVVIAADGEAALERAARDRPDLVVLDIMLPKLDGWAAQRRPTLASVCPPSSSWSCCQPFTRPPTSRR